MEDVVSSVDGSRFWLQTTSHSVQGDRQYQEDEILHERDDDFVYFGVFDGHGGRQASEFAKVHLVANIKAQEGILDNDPSRVIEAIKAGFAETQKAMECAADTWPKTTSGHRSTAGTTASLVLVDRQKARLFVAHLGDSRVLLGRARPSDSDSGARSDCDSDSEEQELWTSTALTIDHKPESEAERERIWRHGGAIMVKYNVPRVVWERRNRNTDVFEQVPFLAIARSLGDLWSFNYESGEYIVSPVPDVECLPITDDLRCLVLGSDGLFNMLSNPEVIDKVQEVEEYLSQDGRSSRSRDPSEELVAMALDRWRRTQLRSDNISVLTVAFRVVQQPERSPGREPMSQTTSEEVVEEAVFSSQPTKVAALAASIGPFVPDEARTLRLPLNHLNQNRACGTKRSRSLDSACAKYPRLHHMDLRGVRDRACKRASSVSGSSSPPPTAGDS